MEQHGLIFFEGIKSLRHDTKIPYERFDHSEKLKNTEAPPYDAFYKKMRGYNLLGAEYTDIVILVGS